MAQMLLMVAALVLAALAPLYWLRLTRRDRGVRAAWRESAQQLGLAFEQPGGRPWPTLIGRLGGLEVSVEVEVGWMTLPDEAWTVAHVRHSGLAGLKLFNGAAAPLLGARPGATSSTSFGRDFDATFTAIGAPELLRARLDNEARRQCLALAEGAVVVDSGVVLVGRLGVLESAGELVALVEGAVALADTLVEPAGIDDGLAQVARTDEFWQNRRSALSMLADRHRPAAKKLASDLLGDAAPEVGLLAAEVLGDDDALRALVDRPDASGAVRMRALEGLVQGGAAGLGSAVAPLLTDSDAELVERALDLLRKAAPSDLSVVLPPLVPLVEQRDEVDPQGQWDRVGRALAACMATTGTSEVEEALGRLASHFMGSTRQAAVLALGMVGSEASVPLLIRLRDGGGGRAAQRALADIEARGAGKPSELSLADIERVMDPISVRRTPGIVPARARPT